MSEAAFSVPGNYKTVVKSSEVFIFFYCSQIQNRKKGKEKNKRRGKFQ